MVYFINYRIYRYAILNDEQKIAFDHIIEHVDSIDLATTPKCFFLHGPAGTGKTFVYNTIANYVRGQGKIVLCVASSGIAALLLTGGRTSHSRFSIPIKIDESSMCFIPMQSILGELINNTALIIWDEVPMQDKLCFEAVDRTFRDVRATDSLFGGIPVILGGDFAQIPPVVKHGNRSRIVNASIRQSYIWSQTEVLFLRTNMRIRSLSENSVHYKDWLREITYTPEFQNTKIQLPDYIYSTTSIDDLINRVYPPEILQDPLRYSHQLFKSAILSTRNDTVDVLNNRVLNAMRGDMVDLISADSVLASSDTGDELFQMSPEYLQTLNPNNFPPSRLSLKVGSIVVLLRNFNPKKGLCNGTRMIIRAIREFSIMVAVLKE